MPAYTKGKEREEKERENGGPSTTSKGKGKGKGKKRKRKREDDGEEMDEPEIDYEALSPNAGLGVRLSPIQIPLVLADARVPPG